MKTNVKSENVIGNTRARAANIELLRVLAMLMVITLHALGHGGVLAAYDFGTPGYGVFWLLEMLCYVSVNVFVLITGYFMAASGFRFSRLVKLAVQVEMYSLVCLFTARYILHVDIGLRDLVRAVLPLSGGAYWFASAYAVLLVLIPLLNRCIRGMDKKTHFSAVLLLLVLFCAVPNFAVLSRNILSAGTDFVWFAVLYFIGAYVRLHGREQYFKKHESIKWFAGYLLLCVGGGGKSSCDRTYDTVSLRRGAGRGYFLCQ